MLKKLMKGLNTPMGYILSIIVLFALYIIFRKREDFAKSVRYMYMYNPTSRNSSYDIRAEPIEHDKDMEKVGIFLESSLDGNQTNQRVRKYYKKFQMDTPEDNKQFEILAYSKM